MNGDPFARHRRRVHQHEPLDDLALRAQDAREFVRDEPARAETAEAVRARSAAPRAAARRSRAPSPRSSAGARGRRCRAARRAGSAGPAPSAAASRCAYSPFGEQVAVEEPERRPRALAVEFDDRRRRRGDRTVGERPDLGRDRGDRRALEERAQAERDAEALLHARREPDGQQRMEARARRCRRRARRGRSRAVRTGSRRPSPPSRCGMLRRARTAARTGVGSARRSTLPFAESGSSGIVTIADGNMKTGSRSPSQARRRSASTDVSSRGTTYAQIVLSPAGLLPDDGDGVGDLRVVRQRALDLARARPDSRGS